MLSEQTKQTLREKLNEYEGKVNHMYLDSKGYVTVGVGHLLESVAAAQALKFVQQEGSAASAAQIATDFESVKAQAPNRVASYYKKYTQLTLAQADIESLTDEHIESFYTELKQLYPEFDSYPVVAQLALFDMIFNLGMTTLKRGFPSFNRAVLARDWQKAAAESHRKAPISEARNQYVHDLLVQAAQ